MFLNLLAEADFSSIFTLASLQVIVALIVIEGLLSVDNALAIAALASHLDEKKRKIAMTIGYAGAYGFRILALFLASYIIHNHWLMVLGASYLIWLMCNHFAESEAEEDHNGAYKAPSFAKTFALIAFLDLSLSFDNVVAAVAFARDSILLVYVGVTIGILTLRLVAGYCIKLLAKHPWLEHTAFLLVGFVGALLCMELFWDTYVRQDLPVFGYELIHGEHSVDVTSNLDPNEVEIAPDGTLKNKAANHLHYHIKKPAKFGGIFLIVLGHMAYEKFPAIKAVFLPIVIVFRHVFAIVARSINSLFWLVTWPIRIVFRSMRRASS